MPLDVWHVFIVAADGRAVAALELGGRSQRGVTASAPRLRGGADAPLAFGPAAPRRGSALGCSHVAGAVAPCPGRAAGALEGEAFPLLAPAQKRRAIQLAAASGTRPAHGRTSRLTLKQLNSWRRAAHRRWRRAQRASSYTVSASCCSAAGCVNAPHRLCAAPATATPAALCGNMWSIAFAADAQRKATVHVLQRCVKAVALRSLSRLDGGSSRPFTLSAGQRCAAPPAPEKRSRLTARRCGIGAELDAQAATK